LSRSAGQFPHGPGASICRPALERRIAAAHGLFRCRGGAPLAKSFSRDAARFTAASLGGNGTRGCRGDATLASPIHRRRVVGLAHVGGRRRGSEGSTADLTRLSEVSP